mgnify:CR=1 FL=1
MGGIGPVHETLSGAQILCRLLEEQGLWIRDVRQGPDGFIYLLTDNPRGLLVRLRPG